MRFYICLKKGQDYQVILALASAIPEQVRLPVAFHNVVERNLLLLTPEGMSELSSSLTPEGMSELSSSLTPEGMSEPCSGLRDQRVPRPNDVLRFFILVSLLVKIQIGYITVHDSGIMSSKSELIASMIPLMVSLNPWRLYFKNA